MRIHPSARYRYLGELHTAGQRVEDAGRKYNPPGPQAASPRDPRFLCLQARGVDNTIVRANYDADGPAPRPQMFSASFVLPTGRMQFGEEESGRGENPCKRASGPARQAKGRRKRVWRPRKTVFANTQEERTSHVMKNARRKPGVEERYI